MSSRVAAGRVPGTPDSDCDDSDFADVFDNLTRDLDELSGGDCSDQSDSTEIADDAPNPDDDSNLIFLQSHNGKPVEDYCELSVKTPGSPWETLANAKNQYSEAGHDGIAIVCGKRKSDGLKVMLRAFQIITEDTDTTYYVVVNPSEAEKMSRALTQGYFPRTMAEKIAVGNFEGIDLTKPRMCSITAFRIMAKPAKATQKQRGKQLPQQLQSSGAGDPPPATQKKRKLPVDTAPPSPKRVASGSLETPHRSKKVAPSPLRKKSAHKSTKPSTQASKSSKDAKCIPPSPLKTPAAKPTPKPTPTQAQDTPSSTEKSSDAAPGITLSLSFSSPEQLKRVVSEISRFL